MSEAWPASPVDYSVFGAVSAAPTEESFILSAIAPISPYADLLPGLDDVLTPPPRSPSTAPFVSDALPFSSPVTAAAVAGHEPAGNPTAVSDTTAAAATAAHGDVAPASSSHSRSPESSAVDSSQAEPLNSCSDSSDSSSACSSSSPSPASPSPSSSSAAHASAQLTVSGIKRPRSPFPSVLYGEEEEGDREQRLLEEDREKKHRWAVIAATTNRVKELYDEIAAWKEGYRRQQEHVRALTGELQAATAALFAATRCRYQQRLPHTEDGLAHNRNLSALDSHIGSMVLGCPLSGTQLMAVTLIDVMSGRIYDCNTRFLDGMPLPRDQVIGVRAMRSYDDLMMDDKAWAATRPAPAPNAGFIERAEYGHEKQQYPESMEQMRQLWRGEVERIDVVMRCAMGTTSMYEIKSMFWVQEWTEVEDVQGCMVQRPRRMLGIPSMSDAKPVD